MNELERLKHPATLDEIVGQPATRHLRDLIANPRQSCWILEGTPGLGKTASAQAVAEALGCHDELSGCRQIPCTVLGVDEAKELFGRTLRLRYGSASGFNCLILDECEWLSPQCQRFLKDALDPRTRMPKNLIVVATSNDCSLLDEALLDRFRLLTFQSGSHFQSACLDRLGVAWERLTGQSCLPYGADGWGFKDGGFSMRRAIRAFEQALSSTVSLQVA